MMSGRVKPRAPVLILMILVLELPKLMTAPPPAGAKGPHNALRSDFNALFAGGHKVSSVGNRMRGKREDKENLSSGFLLCVLYVWMSTIV